MEFSKIIAVTGKPGLFQVISQSKNAIIAQSLIDKNTHSGMAALLALNVWKRC